MFSYDPALLTATATPPQTIEDVLATMRTMEPLIEDGDGLKWFHWLYKQVTGAVASRVAAGGFGSTAWLAELDVQFARLYFDALRAWLSGKPAPGCWRAVFDRRSQTATARIQFALAGINAHINHDLPAAIVATCRKTGTVPLHGTAIYHDYCAVNGTLDSLVDTAKRVLMVRLLGDPLPPISHLEDTLAGWSMVAAREAAWTNAEMLWAVRALPPLTARYLKMLDGITTVAGKTMLTPVPLALALNP